MDFRKIINFDILAKTPQRKTALEIIERGLQAIDTSKVAKNLVKLKKNNLSIGQFSFELKKGRKVFLTGVGKCGSEAAIAIEDILGGRLSAGIVLDVKETKNKMPGKVLYYSGTHPFPSEKNVEAAGKVVDLLKSVKEEDLVIFVISGGGSTLLCLPPEGISWKEEENILKELFACGAQISEINTLRKHLSKLRGGFMAQYIYPAEAVSLIFSDVPGNDLEFVASGPTVKDVTTIVDAKNILKKYNLAGKCGLTGCGLLETPKEDKYFEKIHNIMAVSNKLALDAMSEKAKELGFSPVVKTDRISGEAFKIGEEIIRELKERPKGTVMLYGGETTVTVDKHGRGGRNGELALSALRFVGEGELLAAVASDGRDNGEYAGAVVDLGSRQKAEELSLDIEKHLRNHDPAPFFEQTGDFLMAGDTGSNVSDLLIAIKN